MEVIRTISGIAAGLAVIAILSIAAPEVHYNLTHVDISRNKLPTDKVDVKVMIDQKKLSKALRWPLYPKEAFIGTTREKGSDWVTGWYVKISSDNSISAPYAGFVGTAEPIEVHLPKTKNSQK